MKYPLVAAALLAISAPGQAALFSFSGTITNHNDVIQIAFTTNADATNVRVWTDSFKDGLNFDPITALWKADGTRLAQNDDDDSIDPATQTSFDSGFSLPFLEAGSYIFTIAAYNNFSNGLSLSEGFMFDDQTPIPIGEWNQPANGVGKGSIWSVWLDGVDAASAPGNAVPEPGLFALLAAGALSASAFRRRKAA